jgi:antitoxin component HigA of HigAB toxin-antitoxin module
MQEEKRNQNLTKAVHQSRNLHLADAEKTVLLQDEVKAEQKKAEQKAPEQQAPEQQAPEQQAPEQKTPEKKTRVQAGPQR